MRSFGFRLCYTDTGHRLLASVLREIVHACMRFQSLGSGLLWLFSNISFFVSPSFLHCYYLSSMRRDVQIYWPNCKRSLSYSCQKIVHSKETTEINISDELAIGDWSVCAEISIFSRVLFPLEFEDSMIRSSKFPDRNPLKDDFQISIFDFRISIFEFRFSIFKRPYVMSLN